MPLSLLVDIVILLNALVSDFHPDSVIRSNFQLHRSDNLHKDSHQNSWIYPRVIKKEREREKRRSPNKELITTLNKDERTRDFLVTLLSFHLRALKQHVKVKRHVSSPCT